MSSNREKGGCGGIFGLFWLFMIIRGCISGGDDTDNVPNYVDSDEIKITGPTISHNLNWSDTEHPDKNYTGTVTLNSSDYYDSKRYKASCSAIEMTENELKNSSEGLECLKEYIVWNKNISNYSAKKIIFESKRERIYPVGFRQGWTYKKSYLYDKSKLDFLYSMFNEIQKKENLTRYEFADMVTSYVQNIEYSLPWGGDCREDYNNVEMVKDLVDQGYDCYSYVPFGYYSPVEFIGNWTGDCDTRSTLVYTVLKHYGYDVVILGSQFYGHSILGINLTPLKTYNPSYKIHDRKKYYAWELTGPSVLGRLDPSWDDMRHWKVDLDNELDYSIITYIE